MRAPLPIRRTWAIASGALLLGTAACAGPGDTPQTAGGSAAVSTHPAPPTPGPTAPPTPGGTSPVPPAPPVAPLTWTTCGTNAQCATLQVPVDYQAPDGPTMSIGVARLSASRPGPDVRTVFVNPGGPGASGVDLIKGGGPSKTLARDMNVMSWDPRGVGESSAVACDEGAAAYRSLDWSPDDTDEQQALDDAARGIAAICATRFGSLLDHVTTDDTARDLDQLRRAIGEEQLTYIGLSYGTYVGERYAELFPTLVRAMVLDGVVDPEQDLGELLRGQVLSLERWLDVTFATCDADPACATVASRAAYDRLAVEVERHPMATANGPLGPTALMWAAVTSSYHQNGAEAFLAALAEAGQGDAGALAQLADDYSQGSSYTSYLAILCADLPHPNGAESFQQMARELSVASPHFGAAVANEVLPCAFWSAAPPPPATAVRAVGSAPILVVGNTGDVATPFESAQHVAETLHNAVLLTHDGEGHTSYGKSRCVNDAIEAYLVSLTLPPVGLVCR